jgi:hypothetical protein
VRTRAREKAVPPTLAIGATVGCSSCSIVLFFSLPSRNIYCKVNSLLVNSLLLSWLLQDNVDHCSISRIVAN